MLYNYQSAVMNMEFPYSFDTYLNMPLFLLETMFKNQVSLIEHRNELMKEKMSKKK